MRVSDEQRVMIINGLILLIIVLLIWSMPKSFIEPEPLEGEDEPPPEPPYAAASMEGEQSILVLLSEYNFDYEPRMTASATGDVRFCSALPFIDQSGCPPPAEELAFTLVNETSHGWIGYAVFESEEHARNIMRSYAAVTSSAQGSYVGVSDDIGAITSYELETRPDDMLVFYHPIGGRFEHAWIARFGQLIIYGYEHTPQRRINRKFTHAFDETLRERVLARYNLTFPARGYE